MPEASSELAYPVLRALRPFAHDPHRRRIGRQRFQLSEQAEVGQCRSRAEEIVVQADMALEEVEQSQVARLDDRRVLRRASDQCHPTDLPLGEAVGGRLALYSAVIGKGVVGDPMPGIGDVGCKGPAVMEHDLGAPFVRHVLDQVAEEGVPGIVRDDGALAWMPTLQVVGDGRAVDMIAPVLGVAQHRHQRRLDVRHLVPVTAGAQHPVKGEPPVAHDRPEFHRVRRTVCPDQPVPFRARRCRHGPLSGHIPAPGCGAQRHEIGRPRRTQEW